MSVKTDGKTFKRYYADKESWPDETYHDDTVIYVDGVNDCDTELDLLQDAAKVEIVDGVVFMRGNQNESVDLCKHFRQWLKKQTHISVSFDIPKDKESAVREAVENALHAKSL